MKSIWKLLSAAIVLFTSPCPAQQFPAKPITLVVPFAAGGSNDIIARVISEQLQRNFGQLVVRLKPFCQPVS